MNRTPLEKTQDTMESAASLAIALTRGRNVDPEDVQCHAAFAAHYGNILLAAGYSPEHRSATCESCGEPFKYLAETSPNFAPMECRPCSLGTMTHTMSVYSR